MKLLLVAAFLVLLLVPSVLALQDIYRVELRVDKNYTLELIDVYKDTWTGVTDDSKLNKTADNVLRADLIGEDGKVLSSTYFPAYFFVFDGPQDLNETLVPLELPYFNNTQTLKIYKANQEKLSFGLKTNLCNNNKACDNKENVYSCPGDCTVYSKDRVCAGVSYDGGCDPDCPPSIDVDCQKNQTAPTPSATSTVKQPSTGQKGFLGFLDEQTSWIFLIVVVVIIIIVLVVILLKRR